MDDNALQSRKCEIELIKPDSFLIEYTCEIAVLALITLFFLHLLAYFIFRSSTFDLFLIELLIIIPLSLPNGLRRNRWATEVVIDDKFETVSLKHSKRKISRTIAFGDIQKILVKDVVLIVLDNEIFYVLCKLNKKNYSCLRRIRSIEWGKWSRIFVSKKIRRELAAIEQNG